MSRPDRTITCAQVTIVEAADTLETSPVGVEVMPRMGKKLCCCWYNYLFIGIYCINNHVKRCVPGVGQFVGDEVTVVVRVTTAGEVVPA